MNRPFLAPMSVLLALCGCSPATTTGDAGTGGDSAVSQQVGATGATVTGTSGAGVEIPAGALGREVAVRIVTSATPPVAPPTTLPSAGDAGASGESVTAFTAPIELLPHGTMFDHPVLVTVPVDRTRLSADDAAALDAAAAQTAAAPSSPGTVNDTVGLASRLGVMRLSDDSATTWEPVDTGVSVTADGKLTFLTDRFSYYYVFSAAPISSCRPCGAADQTAYDRCLTGLNWYQCLTHATCTGTLSYRGTPVTRADPVCQCGAGVYHRVGNAITIGSAAYCTAHGTCSIGATGAPTCACATGFSGPTCTPPGSDITCDQLADAVDHALMCSDFVRSAFVGSTECGQLARPAGSSCYSASQAFLRCALADVPGNFGCDHMNMSMSGVGYRADNGAATCQAQLNALQACH